LKKKKKKTVQNRVGIRVWQKLVGISGGRIQRTAPFSFDSDSISVAYASKNWSVESRRSEPPITALFDYCVSRLILRLPILLLACGFHFNLSILCSDWVMTVILTLTSILIQTFFWHLTFDIYFNNSYEVTWIYHTHK